MMVFLIALEVVFFLGALAYLVDKYQKVVRELRSVRIGLSFEDEVAEALSKLPDS